MAHQVTCVYCQKVFDRDKIAYVTTGSRRYGHAICYYREKQKGKERRELDIIDPDDFVECCVCRKTINKLKDKYEQVGASKFAHVECAELERERPKTDQEKLDNYICKLFKIDYVPPRIKKQITQYMNQYNYTYTGILKALTYFYEIKGNSIDKANMGIGIVPYVYNDAYNYYYSLWLAQETNKGKDVRSYIPKIVEIVIPVPQSINKMRTKFNFLDKDEVDAE